MKTRGAALMSLFVVVVSLLLGAASALPTAHIIAHSHCDPGWLETFEAYYTRDVRAILDGVVAALARDETKRFVWSEVSFFSRWYEVQSVDTKKRFKMLLERGQIEFVNGGWSQADEACPDVSAAVDQMAEGHAYLLKNFGVQPRVAWQIDPFGHSAVTPSLFALMGYDALVINRVHHAIKAEFKSARHMEFVWRGNDVGAGDAADMFTHVLHTHYSAPQGFDWEEPGSPFVNTMNANERAFSLTQALRERLKAYRTEHLLVPWGDDFKFRSADVQFRNMDQLVRAVNANPERYGMRIRYSTPSEYLREVYEEARARAVQFPVYTGDFFPYADNADSYWTGYYTTRPFMKAASRRVAAARRTAETLHALVRGNPDPAGARRNRSPLPRDFWERQFRGLETARQDAALFLHHDAITGTSRDTVVSDYMSRMNDAATKLQGVARAMLQRALQRHPGEPPALTVHPFALAPRDGHVYPLVVHNPLAWARREVVTVRAGSPHVWVTNAAGHFLEAQVEARFPAYDAVEPEPGSFDVHFVAELPPLGAVTFFVAVTAADQPRSPRTTTPVTVEVHGTAGRGAGGGLRGFGAGAGAGASAAAADAHQWVRVAGAADPGTPLTLQNELLTVALNAQTGLVASMTDRRSGVHVPLRQRFYEYRTDRSGAYIFRPREKAGEVFARVGCVRVVRGPVVSHFTVRYGDYDVRGTLAAGSDPELGGHLQLASAVTAKPNHELVIRFATELRDGSSFFTSSGLEFERRTRQEFPIAANFYPMVTAARIADDSRGYRLTVLSTHSMACGSQAAGELEMMVHRSLQQDDGRGLSQAVYDSSRVVVPFWLRVDQAGSDQAAVLGPRDARRSLRQNNPPLVLFGTDAPVESPAAYAARHFTEYRPMASAEGLPAGVHLQSMLARDSVSDDVVLRLQGLSPAVDEQVDVKALFSREMGFRVVSVREATLTANQELPLGHYPKKRMLFGTEQGTGASGGWLSMFSGNARPKPSDTAVERQNTEEEGVFISAAALEKVGAVPVAAPAPPPAAAAAPATAAVVMPAAGARAAAAPAVAVASAVAPRGAQAPMGGGQTWSAPPSAASFRSDARPPPSPPRTPGRVFGLGGRDAKRRLLSTSADVPSFVTEADDEDDGEKEGGEEAALADPHTEAMNDALAAHHAGDGDGGEDEADDADGVLSFPRPRDYEGGSLTVTIRGKQLRTLVVDMTSSYAPVSDKEEVTYVSGGDSAAAAVAGVPQQGGGGAPSGGVGLASAFTALWGAASASSAASVGGGGGGESPAPQRNMWGGSSGGRVVASTQGSYARAPERTPYIGGDASSYNQQQQQQPAYHHQQQQAAAVVTPASLQLAYDQGFAEGVQAAGLASWVSPLGDNASSARLLPWSWEYAGVLLIALSAVLFFVQHLGIGAGDDDGKGGGFPQVPGLTATAAGRARLAAARESTASRRGTAARGRGRARDLV